MELNESEAVVIHPKGLFLPPRSIIFHTRGLEIVALNTFVKNVFMCIGFSAFPLGTATEYLFLCQIGCNNIDLWLFVWSSVFCNNNELFVPVNNGISILNQSGQHYKFMLVMEVPDFLPCFHLPVFYYDWSTKETFTSRSWVSHSPLSVPSPAYILSCLYYMIGRTGISALSFSTLLHPVWQHFRTWIHDNGIFFLFYSASLVHLRQIENLFI